MPCTYCENIWGPEKPTLLWYLWVDCCSTDTDETGAVLKQHTDNTIGCWRAMSKLMWHIFHCLINLQACSLSSVNCTSFPRCCLKSMANCEEIKKQKANRPSCQRRKNQHTLSTRNFNLHCKQQAFKSTYLLNPVGWRWVHELMCNWPSASLWRGTTPAIAKKKNVTAHYPPATWRENMDDLKLQVYQHEQLLYI